MAYNIPLSDVILYSDELSANSRVLLGQYLQLCILDESTVKPRYNVRYNLLQDKLQDPSAVTRF